MSLVGFVGLGLSQASNEVLDVADMLRVGLLELSWSKVIKVI